MAADNTTRTAYTVDSLLAVTVQVFNERGYDGTSMEDLSRAAGISKSSIYHHVRGKEELLERAVGRALEGLFGILDEPQADQGRAIERLEHVVHRTVELLMAELPYVTLLLRVRGNTATERDALARRREFDHRVAQLAAEAVAEGDLRAGLDPRLTARLVFGMVNSISEWYRPHADGADSDGAVGDGAVDNRAVDNRAVGDGASGAPDGEAAALADAVTALVFDGLRSRPRP